MVDTVEIKAKELLLIFQQIKMLEDKIDSLTQQQEQMAKNISELSTPRDTRKDASVWKSIKTLFQWA